MRRLVLLWMVGGCARAVDDDQPCFEAQVAMGARLEGCTGDPERGTDLMDALEADYRCAYRDDPRFDLEVEGIETGAYECAFALRNLACELAESYDQDVDAWLTASPVCELLWVPR